MPRVSRALFPLGSAWDFCLRDFPLDRLLADILCDSETVERFSVACWCELVVLFLNRLYNGCQGFGPADHSKAQRGFLDSIEMSVKRWLVEDCEQFWTAEDVAQDMSKKSVSYTGEEICKAEPLTVFRVSPALAPEGHGGSIECVEWLEGKNRWYLEHPHECLLPDTGQTLPRLQARVHVAAGEEKALGELLVRRNICCWVEAEKVIQYRGQRVLNGLFGVPKATILSNGQSSLRCIMNLIPSNSILRTIPGKVARLPSIMQWLHVCVEDDQTVALSQSDMVSAFYLFRIPQQWSEMLAFNLSFSGDQLGFEGPERSKQFYLACKVLPMGWTSAVGVMQQIAEAVLLRGGVPSSNQLVRGKAVPAWMVQIEKESEETGKVWWHVYLDNFACGEKLVKRKPPEGGMLQSQVEALWDAAGILSSKGKSVRNQSSAVELGAFVGGKGKWIGAATERCLKLAKATMWLLDKPKIGKKNLQIVLGRWVFAMQFRRPFMSHFEAVWRSLGTKRKEPQSGSKVRTELLMAMFGMPLLHTWMGSKIDVETTCSDASMTGGAIAVSDRLTAEGRNFLESQREENRPQEIPVVLVSLFNGIGGATRSYDICGVRVKGSIIADNHPPANRVFNRRWPGAHVFLDVRSITKEILEEALLGMEPFEEIHFWAGFPCVDLSSARANRRNLAGEGSGLIFEAIRIYKLAKELFPSIRVRFIFENVASMDISARNQISELLGVEPFKLDPQQQVPMSRPRFCWTDVDIYPTEEISLVQKEGYTELNISAEMPSSDKWLDEGSEETHAGVTYPTCMKAIVRTHPPPVPAGLDRTPMMARTRWEQDGYKFPPYQYKDCYLIWDSRLQRCRLLNSLERERLMGFGDHHTSLAFSASKAKANKSAWENERCSLIGDSFSIYSFMVIAAYAAAPWTRKIDVQQMSQRMGLPAGMQLRFEVKWPLGCSGFQLTRHYGVEQLNAQLLARTNHTGSDVRVVTGSLMSDKSYPRESVQSAWWAWRPIFSVHWSRSEHINALETRSIYLALLWKARGLRFCNRKLFHITDSYVALSILAKGRTSSFALQPIVRKICALLLGGSSHLILSHVDSADNPTDEGSRRKA